MVSAAALAKAERRKRSEQLGKRLYQLEYKVEDHSAVLRKDPNAMAAAYDEYIAQAPPMGWQPGPEDRDRYIADIEKTLEEDIGDSVFLRLRWIFSATSLLQMLMLRAALEDDAMYLDAIEIMSSLLAAHTFKPSHMVIPANPHPTLAREFGLNGQKPYWQTPPKPRPLDPEDDPPMVLPARAFTLQDVMTARRVPVSSDEVTGYKRNPDQLPRTFFMSSATPGEEEAFRVSSILQTGGGKLFYLVFADEGPEAVCYSPDEFFELLSSSLRLVYNH